MGLRSFWLLRPLCRSIVTYDNINMCNMCLCLILIILMTPVSEIICELPDTWTMYLNKWPTYLESLVFNILKSIKPTSVTKVDNIWNQCDSHFLIKMCCRQDKMFQCVCEVLNSMLTCSDCNKALLYVIRQFIASVNDYCIRSNKDIVDLYPRCVQSTVMCSRLGMFSNVATFAQNLPSNWKFILSTHHPKLTDLLLQKKTLL